MSQEVDKVILKCVEEEIYGTGMFFVVNVANGGAPVTHSQIIARLQNRLNTCSTDGENCNQLAKALVDMHSSKNAFSSN